MKLNWKKSELVEGTFEANVNVTMVAEASDRVMENTNGTQYRVLTVKLPTSKQVSAIIYESNFEKGVEVGTVYLAKAIYNPERGKEVLIQMSHLTGADRANVDDLGFEMPSEEVSDLAKAKQEAEREIA